MMDQALSALSELRSKNVRILASVALVLLFTIFCPFRNAQHDYFSAEDKRGDWSGFQHPGPPTARSVEVVVSPPGDDTPFETYAPNLRTLEPPEETLTLSTDPTSQRQSHFGPTYAQMCRQMLEQPSNPPSQTSPGNNVFRESAEVCLEADNISSSLSQIFLSTFLAHQMQRQGMVVTYRPDCGLHSGDHRLLQKFLPSPLVVPFDLPLVEEESLVQICQRAVSGEPAESIIAKSVEVAASSELTDSSTGLRTQTSRHLSQIHQVRQVSLLQILEPLLQANLDLALQWALQSNESVEFKYGNLSAKHARSGTTALRTTVIYLSCLDARCQSSKIIPYYEYLLHIPLSVQAVDVVVPPGCVTENELCKKYVGDLASTIRHYNTKVAVEVIGSMPSSMDTIARLLTSEHVICGPGWGLTCLLPALSRTTDLPISGATPETALLQFTFLEPMSETADVSRSELLQIAAEAAERSHIQLSDLSVTSQLLETSDLPSFAQMSPDTGSGSCRFLRGRVGYWLQDMLYAETAQYRTPLAHYPGRADQIFHERVRKGETRGLKFRRPTTYRWEEDKYPTCQASLVTRQGMCSLLRTMDIRRIFVLGDSLSLETAQSLFMWLSRNGNRPDSKRSNFRLTLSCSEPGGVNSEFEFVLQYVRNDKLLENKQTTGRKVDDCNYCYRWSTAYSSFSGRTLLLVNTGAHMHDYDEYRAGVDRFVETFDHLDRPDDIVLYRTLVPGHWGCDRPNLVPYRSFIEYMRDTEKHRNEGLEAVFTWSEFTNYNDYAVRKLEARRYGTTSGRDQRKARMEILDVYPMTVLRPDGHCSDEYGPTSHDRRIDCLHYSLPGPIDWWSHLAFSHLLDIASLEKKNGNVP